MKIMVGKNMTELPKTAKKASFLLNFNFLSVLYVKIA